MLPFRILVALAVVVLPVAAHAQDKDHGTFGAEGQKTLSASTNLGLDPSISRAARTRAALTFAPGFDVFVGHHVSIGAELLLGGSASSDSIGVTKGFLVGLGPRVGIALPLSADVTLYPRVAAGVRSAWDTLEAPSPDGGPLPAVTTNHLGAYVSLFVPVVVHPSSRIFVGLGPGFTQSFGSRNALATDVGGEVVIGAAWGS